MMQRSILPHLLLLGCLFAACGGGSSTNIAVSFQNGTGITACTAGSPTCSDPFKDPSVVDVVFIINNIAPDTNVVDAGGTVVIAAGTILDTNTDGSPDSLIYPTTCSTAIPSSCGFIPTASNFNISGLPLNYRFTMTVRFRNTAGTALYEGISAPFDNIASNSGISVTINKVVAP